MPTGKGGVFLLPMDLGLLYAIVAFICAVVVAIILNRARITKNKEAVDRAFCTLAVFFLFFCLVDGLWGLFFSSVLFRSWLGYTVFTYGFHMMAALSAFVWAGYLIQYMGVGKKNRVVLNVIRGALVASQFTILISNFWTHGAFVIHRDTLVYETGFWRTVLFWLQFAYYIVMTTCVLLMLLLKRTEKKRSVYGTAMIFSFIPLIAGVFQLLYPDAPMYSIGFLVSAVTIYSFNITSQREQYLAKLLTDENTKLTAIISGLSDDYQKIFYIDMETDHYEVFGKGDFVRAQEKKTAVTDNDFFADRLVWMNQVIYEEDRHLIEDLLGKEALQKELETKRSFSFNYRRYVDGNLRYCMMKVIRPDNKEGENRVIIGVFDDDERLRKEMNTQERLREALVLAEEASAAKTNFLFNMSHDIRTPMNAILGFTDIAKKNLNTDPDAASRSLDKVRNAGGHLLSIINDILDMSRIENGKVVIENQPLSIGKCFEDLLDIVGDLAREKNISVTREGSLPPHDRVYADKTHLSRIFMNVLTNAIKYTGEGGAIVYSVTETPCEDEGRSIYEFRIRDNGIGMSREYLSHIFEMFSRERSSTISGIQGTGLGMAITKSLTDLMNGTINIESEPGKGTTVILTVPFLIADERFFTDDATSEADVSVLRGKKLLLVEDNELNREIATDILSELGLEIDEADDGTKAVQKCRELIGKDASARYDLILMDIQMPTMDGYTATREIRKLPDPYFARVPIIAMTANVFAEDVKRSEEAGMNAHLGKPIDTAELVRVLVRLQEKN